MTAAPTGTAGDQATAAGHASRDAQGAGVAEQIQRDSPRRGARWARPGASALGRTGPWVHPGPRAPAHRARGPRGPRAEPPGRQPGARRMRGVGPRSGCPLRSAPPARPERRRLRQGRRPPRGFHASPTAQAARDRPAAATDRERRARGRPRRRRIRAGQRAGRAARVADGVRGLRCGSSTAPAWCSSPGWRRPNWRGASPSSPASGNDPGPIALAVWFAAEKWPRPEHLARLADDRPPRPQRRCQVASALLGSSGVTTRPSAWLLPWGS